MPLTAGARLGPYEIQSAIGAGGMGEVYRARDTKLDRDVAIKVLPDLFAADPDRLARFEREAQSLAALNHTLLKEPGGISSVRISPDGRWLAFDSTTEGPFQVYVMSITGKGARVAVTARGGQAPRWSRDGRRLFFRREGALIAVDIDTSGGEIHFGPERKVLEWDIAGEYDVAATGEFYSMEPAPGAAHQTSIQLRTGWFAEVDRLVRRPTR